VFIIIIIIVIITCLLTNILQLSCHSVAVFLTLVQTKQIKTNLHKQNKKHSTNNTKHSKYKYTSNIHGSVHRSMIQ